MTDQLSLSFECRHIHQRTRLNVHEIKVDITWCLDCDTHICEQCEATIPPGGEMYTSCKECHASSEVTMYNDVLMCEHGVLTMRPGRDCVQCHALGRK